MCEKSRLGHKNTSFLRLFTFAIASTCQVGSLRPNLLRKVARGPRSQTADDETVGRSIFERKNGMAAR
ncbi:hypothetical protein CEE69_16870 [Rhodopirellula bahusiensis]|uniref:Uncharacterized protein n=1 Tax=Rhodopirellula bahusiensis TaxID=2014065 RepID=A0A2G1W4R3_9BACT|nr:hypothetical protein CEE69_16870 [Rhodopirellula bahusiensis]